LSQLSSPSNSAPPPVTPQSLREYEAAIEGCRLEHLICDAARRYVVARELGSGFAHGHYRRLRLLVSRLIRGR